VTYLPKVSNFTSTSLLGDRGQEKERSVN